MRRYERRWIVERFFAWIQWQRRLPVRWEYQPRAEGRREVQMEPRTARQAGLDPGVLVRAAVVADQMHVEMVRDVRFDVPHERRELLVTVLVLTVREYGTVGHVERREQGRRTVAHVVVGDALDEAKAHRQHRLVTLKRLALIFLVHAQHHRVIRWVEVLPDDVTNLLEYEGIVRQLEALRLLRLQPEQRR